MQEVDYIRDAIFDKLRMDTSSLELLDQHAQLLEILS